MQALINSAATAAVVMLTLSSASAVAAQPVPPRATVSYSQAEFLTDDGALAVYRRIAAAARKVCPGEDSMELTAISVSRECQKDAIARAVAQIPQPRLAQIAARRANRG